MMFPIRILSTLIQPLVSGRWTFPKQPITITTSRSMIFPSAPSRLPCRTAMPRSMGCSGISTGMWSRCGIFRSVRRRRLIGFSTSGLSIPIGPIPAKRTVKPIRSRSTRRRMGCSRRRSFGFTRAIFGSTQPRILRTRPRDSVAPLFVSTVLSLMLSCTSSVARHTRFCGVTGRMCYSLSVP